MSDSPYPLTLYRSGTSFEWDGRQTDSLIVNDEDEHLQADGWQEAADYLAKSGDAPKRGRPPKVTQSPAEN